MQCRCSVDAGSIHHTPYYYTTHYTTPYYTPHTILTPHTIPYTTHLYNITALITVSSVLYLINFKCSGFKESMSLIDLTIVKIGYI